MNYHEPVLLKEAIDGLNVLPEGIYVDLTYGGGGHSREILTRLTTGILYSFDVDKDAEKNVVDNMQMVFIRGNFRNMKQHLAHYHVEKVDGIIADLGISSHHIDSTERGFSSRHNAPLDMRMNKDNKLTAEKIINEYDENALTQIFYNYGEIWNARSLVKNILMVRKNKKISTTYDLKDATSRFALKGKENKFFAKVFQALRIAVNDELESLKEMISQTTDLLKNGGRLVVISYHSLEDRIVKRFMKTGNTEGNLFRNEYGNTLIPYKMITKKPIVPSDMEITRNPRARSAKLRIAELL